MRIVSRWCVRGAHVSCYVWDRQSLNRHSPQYRNIALLWSHRPRSCGNQYILCTYICTAARYTRHSRVPSRCICETFATVLLRRKLENGRDGGHNEPETSECAPCCLSPSAKITDGVSRVVQQLVAVRAESCARNICSLRRRTFNPARFLHLVQSDHMMKSVLTRSRPCGVQHAPFADVLTRQLLRTHRSPEKRCCAIHISGLNQKDTFHGLAFLSYAFALVPADMCAGQLNCSPHTP